MRILKIFYRQKKNVFIKVWGFCCQGYLQAIDSILLQYTFHRNKKVLLTMEDKYEAIYQV